MSSFDHNAMLLKLRMSKILKKEKTKPRFSIPTPLFPASHKFPTVYPPSEDSFLLLDAVERDWEVIKTAGPGKVVEMGCGTGLVAAALACNMEPEPEILCIDSNSQALECVNETFKMNDLKTPSTLLSDLFEKHDASKINVIIFNPPYVPSTNIQLANSQGIDKAWAGGENGSVIIKKFIEQAIPLLADESSLIYIVILKQNFPGDWEGEEGCRLREYLDELENGKRLYVEVVLRRRVWCEDLAVVRIGFRASTPVEESPAKEVEQVTEVEVSPAELSDTEQDKTPASIAPSSDSEASRSNLFEKDCDEAFLSALEARYKIPDDEDNNAFVPSFLTSEEYEGIMDLTTNAVRVEAAKASERDADKIEDLFSSDSDSDDGFKFNESEGKIDSEKSDKTSF